MLEAFRVAIPLRGYVVCNMFGGDSDAEKLRGGRNPLTGLCGLQLYPSKNPVLDGTARGGFMRKMKLGICTRRITGVFGGLRP